MWERYINDWLRTSVSGYWYKADRLITSIADPNTQLQSTFVNQGQVRAKGLELEAQMRLPGDSRALLSYAFQNAVDQETPERAAQFSAAYGAGPVQHPRPVRRSTVSVDGWYLSSRLTELGGSVPAATTVNLTVLQPIGRVWQLFGSVNNVFDHEYRRPGVVCDLPPGHHPTERADGSHRPALATLVAVTETVRPGVRGSLSPDTGSVSC